MSIFEAAIEECKTCDSIDEHAWNHGVLVVMAKYESCRAAMLQAEHVTTDNKLPFEQWLSQQTGAIDVECGCVMTEVFFHWLRVAYEAGNSPVIGIDPAFGPDRTVEVRYVAPPGYVMVPKEPTEAMINAWLSEVANWRGHVAGYKAMLAAAPQEVK